MSVLMTNLSAAVQVLAEKGIQVQEIYLADREGKKVYTIMGKVNDRTESFQVNNSELLFFDRTKKRLVEKRVCPFFNQQRIDDLKQAIKQ